MTNTIKRFFWSLHYKTCKVYLGILLWVFSVVGILIKLFPYSFPQLLSFGFPLSFGTLITWILMAVGFTIAMNSTEKNVIVKKEFPNQEKNKISSKSSFDMVFFIMSFIVGASALTFGTSNTNETLNHLNTKPSQIDIFFSLMVHILGLCLGAFMAWGFTSEGHSKTEIKNSKQIIQENENKKESKIKEQNEISLFQHFIFNPFSLGRSSFPLEVLLGAITGCLFGTFFAILFYPFPGNIYSNLLAPIFSLDLDPLLPVLFLLVIIVLFIYPRVDINTFIGIGLIWLSMGLTAFHFWTMNKFSIDAGISMDTLTTSVLSYTFILIGIFWGMYRGYQVWQWRLQKEDNLLEERR